MSRVMLFVASLQFVLVSLAIAGEQKVIIGFRQIPGVAEHEKHDKVYRAGGKIRRIHKHINAVAAQLPEEEIAGLKRDPSVAYVEADSVVSVVDPPQAQTASPLEYADSWGVQHIGADVSAMKGFKGAGAKVAILDTGIDYNHPDLKDNYKGGYNFVYNNDDPLDDSRYGHGTHVAGIVAARGNGTGVVGVAPEASLYAVKVLNGGMSALMSDIVAGIEWAITNKMDIINMSFGGQTDSQAVRDACDLAYKSGIVLVAAAGNFNQPVIDFPASFDSVIAVSATMNDDTKALISNYGDKLELVAPGAFIKSTSTYTGGYYVTSGTSQAAPHVAGVAALIVSAGIKDANSDGNIADDVRKLLAETARDLGDPGRDIYFGYGLVDAAKVAESLARYSETFSVVPGKLNNLKVALKPGTYSVSINNHGLKMLAVRPVSGAEDGGLTTLKVMGIENNGSFVESETDDSLVTVHFKSTNLQKLTFKLQVDAISAIYIVPSGKPGTSAEISISEI